MDVQSTLDKVQCVAQNATIQAQEAVANAAAVLTASNPRITFLGFDIFDLKLKKVKITDPYGTYKEIKKGYLDKLKALQETDSADTIFSAYANIQRVAKNISCAYDNRELKLTLLKEQLGYTRLSEPWSIVSPRVQLAK